MCSPEGYINKNIYADMYQHQISENLSPRHPNISRRATSAIMPGKDRAKIKKDEKDLSNY
jgi:hypothetical protein